MRPFLPCPAARWLVVLGVILALGFAAADAPASGRKKRDPSIAIRVHAQVYAFDPEFTAKVKVGIPPREITIEKLASVSERDIESFYPYRAADGTFSAVLQLDRHGSAVLENLSAQKLGLSLVVAVGGRGIAALKVDKPISDGVIFIPYGLTEPDIRAMGASFSIMGETDADREARKAPKPTPALDDGALPIPDRPRR